MAATITFYSEGNGGVTTVTAPAHGFSDGNKIKIDGSDTYDSMYIISNTTNDTFDVDTAFVGNPTNKGIAELLVDVEQYILNEALIPLKTFLNNNDYLVCITGDLNLYNNLSMPDLLKNIQCIIGLLNSLILNELNSNKRDQGKNIRDLLLKYINWIISDINNGVYGASVNIILSDKLGWDD